VIRLIDYLYRMEVIVLLKCQSLFKPFSDSEEILEDDAAPSWVEYDQVTSYSGNESNLNHITKTLEQGYRVTDCS
jgi:hypothetical protein